jgi:hypothetical protein
MSSSITKLKTMEDSISVYSINLKSLNLFMDDLTYTTKEDTIQEFKVQSNLWLKASAIEQLAIEKTLKKIGWSRKGCCWFHEADVIIN